MKELMNALINMIFGTGASIQIKEINDKYTTILTNNQGVLSGPYNTMKTLGVSLLTLYFLIELAEKTSHDNFTIEHFVRMFIKFIIGYELISKGLSLFTKFISLTNAVTNDISTSINVEETSNGYEAFVAAVDKMCDGNFVMEFLAPLPVILLLMVPALIMMLFSIILQVLFASRIVEMMVRVMFAPIACADIYSEGTRGGGFRYIKKFIALGLQSAVIIAVFIGVSKLSVGSLATKGLSYPKLLGMASQQIVYQAVGVTVAMKAQNVANDIMGV